MLWYIISNFLNIRLDILSMIYMYICPYTKIWAYPCLHNTTRKPLQVE